MKLTETTWIFGLQSGRMARFTSRMLMDTCTRSDPMASSNASWITITFGTNTTGNGGLTYSVSVNKSGLARVGAMSIAGKTFTEKQKPR